MTQLIAPQVSTVLAVDFVQSLLDACPKIGNVTYQLRDVATWDPDLGFDVTVMGEVLEHLLDPIDVLRRIGRHTRYVVASCPVNEELNHDTAWDITKIEDLLTGRAKVGVGEGAGHIWAMDMEGFESLFKASGWDLVHTEVLDVSGIVVAKSLVTGMSE